MLVKLYRVILANSYHYKKRKKNKTSLGCIAIRVKDIYLFHTTIPTHYNYWNLSRCCYKKFTSAFPNQTWFLKISARPQ